MRGFKLLALSVLMALVATMALAQDTGQLPRPVEYSLLPGVHTIAYAGETLTFRTDVALSVKFRTVSFTIIEMRFKGRPAWNPDGTTSASLALEIFWEDGSETIFDGDAPTTQWGELVLSEGGWTEK